MKSARRCACRLPALAGMIALLWLAASTGQAQPKPRLSPSCIDYDTEARYRNLGYDHVVILRNSCETHAVCAVSTSVNQQVHHVEIAPAQTREVVTFIGSPARHFTANVHCQLRRSESE